MKEVIHVEMSQAESRFSSISNLEIATSLSCAAVKEQPRLAKRVQN